MKPDALTLVRVMITILEKIINVTWRHDGQNNEKLCRWIRCLFSLALTSNTAIAEQLLEQVVTIAEGQKKVCDPLLHTSRVSSG